ncbi:MAG: Methyltransferase type 12 [Microgenomates group bacterium GW2011_GWC1_37_8]|nr:MAG: Methyltransferase type 12 [Microgenomates group bacterium GW2011_GWC1_37_8]
MTISKHQLLQQQEYEFPYHYVPRLTPYFSQSIVWEWSLNYIAALRLVLEKLGNMNYSRLIDVGTGDGRLVREISREYPQKTAEGTDYSTTVISLASALNPSLKFFQWDLIKKPLSEEYDAALLIEVLEHLPPKDTRKFLFNLHHSLSSKSSVLVTVPHSNIPVQSKHFTHFSFTGLSSLVSPYFRISESYFLSLQNWQYQIILKLLSNKLFTLSSPSLCQFLFNYYWSNLFFTTENHCSRIFIKMHPK